MMISPTRDRKIRFENLVSIGSAGIKKALNDPRYALNDLYNVCRRDRSFGQRMEQAARMALDELADPDRFADEQVQSDFGYDSGFEKSEDLRVQCDILSDAFPGIGDCNTDLLDKVKQGAINLPDNQWDWYALPNWKNRPDIFGKNIADALIQILGVLKDRRSESFHNFHSNPEELNPDRVRESELTSESYSNLSRRQGDPDILLVPAQFGIFHRGRSARRAAERFEFLEFGLGAFGAGCMLLCHPKRLASPRDLGVDCNGTEFWPLTSEVPFDSVFFFDYERGLQFGARQVKVGRCRYGSVTGLVL